VVNYVLQVDPTATAHPGEAVPATPPFTGRGRRPSLATPTSQSPCGNWPWPRDVAPAAESPGATAARKPRTTRPRRCARTSWPSACGPPTGTSPAPPTGSLPEEWLIAEWPPGKPEPVKYWLSTIDTRTPLATLIRLAKIRWRIEHDYRELKTGLGLDHFEGRSFLGWHRHVTLTVLAQAFCHLLRLDPKADAPA
jgi:SRSO17 transposase